MRTGACLGALVLFLGGAGAARPQNAGAPADSAAADSTRESLHRRLQRQDQGRYDPELFDVDRAFRDSVLTGLDSLGLDAARQQRKLQLRLAFNPAPKLWNYNRVEGLVAGAGVGLRRRGDEHAWVQFQGGYAFGSREFRHHEALRLPLGPRPWGLEIQAHFEGRVLPYGSNGPLWNSVRAFVGGEDARDYLASRGGAAMLQWSPRRAFVLAAGYEAAEETSAAATTEFALLGDMAPVNDPVQEGTDRACVTALRLGSLARHMARLDARHRVAGGGLGGDFTYNRTDLELRLRRYLWRQELALTALYARTGGDAPVQRLADAGGLSTVRGWKRRALVGEASFAGRLEVLVPYDFFRASGVPLLRRLHLQAVPWGDAARTWEGAAAEWIYAAGLGVQHFLGAFEGSTYLRLDVAFPIGPDRSRDLRLELYFATSVF
jgi:hypothetical protein